MKAFIGRMKKKYKLDRVILFGSRARGDNFVDSDFDVVVVSNDFREIPFFKRIDEMLKYWDFSYDLEIFCYTQDEFNKKTKSIFFKPILKEGKIIFENARKK